MVRYVKKRGNTFFATGANSRGAYAVLTHRIKGIGTVKAAVGTRGKTLSVKRNVGKLKCEAGYNLSTKTPYFNARARRGRRRT